MSKHDRPDLQIEGQMTIYDLFDSEGKLIAVHRIFARARKKMSLAEQKTFVYALSELKFKEIPNKNYVNLDKKALAKIIGINSDTNHLSVDVFDNIRELPKHSYVEIREKDSDLFASGFVVSNVICFKNIVRIRFTDDYLPLFTNLSNNYITMWSADIYKMTTRRSVQFYEYLRQISDTRKSSNDVLLGIKALKEVLCIPKEGKGSYMRAKSGFNRSEFEKKVLDPICEDLKNCKMINLFVGSNGKMYTKEKQGNRVVGYRFVWGISEHPAVATAEEVKQIQDRVDKNPEVLKVAKDLLNGKKKKPKENGFDNFTQRDYDYTEIQRVMMQQSVTDNNEN